MKNYNINKDRNSNIFSFEGNNIDYIYEPDGFLRIYDRDLILNDIRY